MVDFERVQGLVGELLVALGQNPDDEGLRETPRRVAKWWREFLEYDPGKLDTAFQSVTSNQLVAVTGIRVWSLCEHHLLPFWCDVTVAYVPDGKVLGLSKLARVAHKHAHRLQLQERLVAGIAGEIAMLAGTSDVAVLASGEHLCMVMRGIKTPGLMHSSVLRGRFQEDARLREELFSIAGRR